ncbi:MFS transporter [Pusillimonas sp. CC-YST705]|uniref:MFS transporter n=1 Tax=Mesopusillimonas faecipullorum TaxID=2755040 RepID=A0ABS8CB80_9BURK|nr:MFS transporter [Mesopusillimonas faecipullorum]MCB5363295.1 MFS transporter [Mesopusillimonas faecipullorum]
MTTTTADALPDTPAIMKRDWKVISLVGVAHSCSHFFQLVFPTLFLSLSAAFGYDYVQLGFLVSVFFIASGVGQAASGFIVDRMGGAPVLLFGLASFVVMGALIGLAQGYPMLMLAAVIGGVGNAVFHPADFAILNHRVSPRRLGHAFSTHGFTGNLGWALTPIFMTTIIHWADWRIAAFAASGLVAAVLIVVWFGRHLLENELQDRRKAAAEEAIDPSSLAHQSIGQTLATLAVQPALWGAFFFFAFASISLSAVQNYTIPMLSGVYGIEKVLAGTALSVYMAASALGMIAGGFLVGTTVASERVVALSLVLAGLLLAFLASGILAPWMAIAFVMLGGFCAGVSTPSRDMLIRRATPKGATGTVYGLVYSGMDVGAAVGPVVFGLMLDAGMRSGPWYGAAITFIVAAWLAWLVARFVLASEARKATA